MNLLGRAAQVYLPDPVRKLLLSRLFADTAAVFGRPRPSLRGLSADQTLARFREFTARIRIEEPESSAVTQRVFGVTYRYGKWLRRMCDVASMEDAMAVARVVYRAIDIDFVGVGWGEITITRCYFSQAYTAETCRLMSALDAGLLAGLSNGGRLGFSQRITEGYSCCLARLDSAEAPP